jgi:hypothetical protein
MAELRLEGGVLYSIAGRAAVAIFHCAKLYGCTPDGVFIRGNYLSLHCTDPRVGHVCQLYRRGALNW